MSFQYLDKSAILSPDRRYRFELRRVWNRELPLLGICGVNPSNADGEDDDPTITRERNFAIAWGFGGLLKMNLAALINKDPKVLRNVIDPVGYGNDEHLLRLHEAKMVVAAWGALSGAPKWLRNRADSVLWSLTFGRDVYAFRITATGMPEHPLYLPSDLRPVLYRKGRTEAATTKASGK